MTWQTVDKYGWACAPPVRTPRLLIGRDDPEFDPGIPAFYYVRVVQNPTCRWSTLQCNAAGIDCSKPDQVADEWKGCCDTGFPKTIQERAWTSPIWYKPVAR